MGENTKSRSIADISELEWINLRKRVDEVMKDETLSEKFSRKFKENPLVPIG